MSTGIVVYRGPSALDKTTPIVGILTFGSANTKTGNMAQLWILLADMAPTVAAREGGDEAICGRCLHRPLRAGSCYVILHQAPTVVWHHLQAGRYPYAEPQELPALARRAGVRSVRLGAYGDPMALPLEVVEGVARAFMGHTGYTHQWMQATANEVASWQRLCMASVDSPVGFARAQAAGWRTFRVRTADQPAFPDEALCPASAEAATCDEDGFPNRTTCTECMRCGGVDACEPKKNPVIIVHGSRSRVSSFKRKSHA